MSFASVYPHYIAKAEKKGRTQAEVDTIICWSTGYHPIQLEEIEDKLMRQIRYLDKLIYELAKGKVMEKILRV
ncbi:DUF2200 family protein [Flavobacterium columnare]|nr:hypothetical protein FC1_15530 [Flavobacterium columnare NBRC 100251 = ATCC 23463]